MKYFTKEELSCKCEREECPKFKLHPSVDIELDMLREQFGRPMKIRSACRCKAHNDTPAPEGGAGGHPNSLHVMDFPAHKDRGQAGCMAVDVEASDPFLRGQLFALAWKLGWSVGWNAKLKFLHLDRRVQIGMQQATFDY